VWSLKDGGAMLSELKVGGEVHDLVCVGAAGKGPLSGGGLLACAGRSVHLLTASDEGALAVVKSIKVPFLARIDSASLHPDGMHLIVGGGDAASAATSRGGVASLYVFMVDVSGPSAPEASAASSKPSTGGASYASALGGSKAAEGKAGPRSFQGCSLVSISRGHVGPIRCLRFSPDGQRFVSGGEDGNIRLWSFDAQRRAGAAGADDIPCVDDSGKTIGESSKGGAKPAAAGGRGKVAYRPGAFGGSARMR
jgi:hypothetical protein